jgi:hypothetical protein
MGCATGIAILVSAVHIPFFTHPGKQCEGRLLRAHGIRNEVAVPHPSHTVDRDGGPTSRLFDLDFLEENWVVPGRER